MENKSLSFGQKIARYTKFFVVPIQNGLQKFSNNILIKSLVAGFVSAMPIILVSSFFILIYAIPEAISPNYLGEGLNQTFNGFKAFSVRAYQFTYGILGLVVTGNIGRAMMEELNHRLPFDKQVKSFNVLITSMVAYFIMSAIPIFSGSSGYMPGDPANDSWFDGILWGQMGAQGILPGILIGLSTPWVFYFCFKWNITIRMPKAVPGVISQSFLSIIPFAIAVLFWSIVSYIFIATLGEPFIPWFFSQLGGLIPQLQYEGKVLTLDEFKQLDPNVQQLVANGALNSFSNSYGMIVLYRFLETFSWFIGVDPEAIQGVFESIMAINQEMNLVLNSAGLNHSFAFVNSLMGPTGNMGGTGATFIVPIICLLFCRSTQSKVAGKTSVIPVAFQVNEPILFGQPIVLNPYYLIPFISVPIINSSLAKLFVDDFGLIATRIDLPWAIPWFIRGPVAQLGKPIVFLLLLICFFVSFFIYLPFVLWYDKTLVKAEILSVGKENFVSMNGLQYQINKMLNFDNHSHKIFVKEKRQLHKNKANLTLEQFEIAKLEITQKYHESTILNLNNIFSKIQSLKVVKMNEKYNDGVKEISDKLSINETKMENFNNRIDEKIEYYSNYEEQIGKSMEHKKEVLKQKKLSVPKIFSIKKELYIDYLINLKKCEIDFEIRKIKIKLSKAKDKSEKEKLNSLIQNFKQELQDYISNKNLEKPDALKKANENLLHYKNPYKLIESENVEDISHELESESEQHILQKQKSTINVLVLCIGAGTSAMLASAINDGAKLVKGTNIKASALAYDSYKDALEGVDLIITSPQLGSYLSSIEKDAKMYQITVVPTKGKQYIDLANNPEAAVNFVKDNLKNKSKEE